MAMSTYIVPTGKIVHESYVDFIHRHSISDPIHLVQYDNSLPVICISMRKGLSDFVLDDSMDVMIRWKKTDGTYIHKKALGCNVYRTAVYFDITQQMVMFPGTTKPVIEILVNNDSGDPSIACSSSFEITIDRNPIQNGDIASSTVYEDPYGNLIYTAKEVDEKLDAIESKPYVDNLIVDTYIKDANDDVSLGISNCINAAIDSGKSILFSSKSYVISSPITINNDKRTTKPINIDFNGATISATKSGVDSIFEGTIGSNNGNVVHNWKNLTIDATYANYGINLSKAIRLRITNLSIKNGLNAAVNIGSGIENYISSFSFWRTNVVNESNSESYGLKSKSTDSYYSDGVIVNYKYSCEGYGANSFTNIHPWYYYSDGETANKSIMSSSVGVICDGMTSINNCEFDSCAVSIWVKDDKSAVNITNSQIVVSPIYNTATSVVPIFVKLADENGNTLSGVNVNATNVFIGQYYNNTIYFSNNSSNFINAVGVDPSFLNIPKSRETLPTSDTLSGENIYISNATSIKIMNTPQKIFVSGRNMIPYKAINYTNKGINLYSDENMLRYKVSGSGIVSDATNLPLLGSWDNTNPLFIFKKGVRYSILNPNKTGIDILFLTQHNVAIQITGQDYLPYTQHLFGNDIPITYVMIRANKDLDLTNPYFFYIAAYQNPKPYAFEKGSVSVLTDYSNDISCNGPTYISTLSGDPVELTYKNGNIVTMSEYDTLVKRIEALENKNS